MERDIKPLSDDFTVADLKEVWNVPATADVLFKAIKNKEGKDSCLCKVGTKTFCVSFKLNYADLVELPQESRNRLPVFITDDHTAILSSGGEWR